MNYDSPFRSYLSKTTPLIIFLLFTYLNLLAGSEFNNEHNHYAGNKIGKLKVCGERCSGTNFVMYLLHSNFPDLEQSDLLEFGQKHFLWWYGTPTNEEKLDKLKYSKAAVELSDSENCLFVVIVRDPYDWLRSFYINPHCVHADLLGQDFFHFLTSEWKLTDLFHELDGQYDEIDNYNPYTRKPFSNVLQLRKYKMINYLLLGTLVNNYLFIRYEDACKHPEEFINFVANYYNLKKAETFFPIETYKGSHVPYVKNNYFPILQHDLEFINRQIDWEIEEAVGYFLKEKVE